MKKFIIDFTLVLLLLFITGELLVRAFHLHGDPIKRENIQGNYLPIPYQKGTFVKGKFKEIHGNYNINNLGFNSIHDYDTNLPANKLKIAIVGDSYIEGAHVDINKGIGSLLEQKLENSAIVYEFGVSETNIVDYENLYHSFNLESFDMVFVVFSIADLYGFKPDSIGQEEKGNSMKNNLFRQVYNQSELISYLNFNHAIFRAITASFKFENVNTSNTPKPKLNTRFLDNKPDNVIAIYNNIFDEDKLINDVDFDYLTITHEYKPYTFGFDRHWNLNGRKNVANLIFETVKGKQ